jgi:hypothetical protein
MIPVHIWAGPNCIGIHDLPRRLRLLDLPSSLRLNPFYKKQFNDLNRFESPLIHIFNTRINNKQWARIHRAILVNEPSIHVIILTQEDVRKDNHSNDMWIVEPLKQTCANARVCSNTQIIVLDLIRMRGKQNLFVRRELKRLVTQSTDVMTRIDAAKLMNSHELDEAGLTIPGEKLLLEIVTQALQEASDRT